MPKLRRDYADTALITEPTERLEGLMEEQWDLVHLDLDYDALEQIHNPFDKMTTYDLAHPDEHLLSLMMNPDYFGWTCKILFGIDLLPIQCAILREMWYSPFPMLVCSRGFGKSTLLGIYSILRALLIQGRKIIITGAGFRQSKMVFAYAEAIWWSSPLLRDICGAQYDREQGPHHNTDVWYMRIGTSTISAVPIGDGGKIRGMRANDILADEFSIYNVQIFEEVIAGFGVVNLDPIQKVKERKRIRELKSRGKWTPEDQAEFDKFNINNQIVLSGTASFAWNHFCKYWKKYKGIIKSGGNSKKLAEVGADAKTIPRDYLVIRIPFDLLPEGFMDEKQIERAKNSNHMGIYQNEYGACFSEDTIGFYKRSVIDSCVTNKPIVKACGPVQFSATLYGSNDREVKYIYGIDPASQQDNISIVILEIHEDHSRLVYGWSAREEDYLNRKNEMKEKSPGTKTVFEELEDDFNSFVVRKIRDLMKTFPCIHIAMDSQGGGHQIRQTLGNSKYLDEKEYCIWEIDETSPLWDGKERPSDNEAGLHILEMVNFSDSIYYSEAHSGMRFDLEQKNILFPFYDPIEVVLAGQADHKANRVFDTLEDCIEEIENLKTEMATIQYIPTATGKDHWDTPSIKEAGMAKGRLHKDRFSACIMAASAARRLRNAPKQAIYVPTGGFVGKISHDDFPAHAPVSGPLYTGPAWFTEQMKAIPDYGKAVNR